MNRSYPLSLYNPLNPSNLSNPLNLLQRPLC